MKYIFYLLILISLSAKSQNINHQYGYVYGQRIDSINAVYATAVTSFSTKLDNGNILRSFRLEYGQSWEKNVEPVITNKEGKVTAFNSVASALNFLFYNGWEVIQVISNAGDSGAQVIVLKKRK